MLKKIGALLVKPYSMPVWWHLLVAYTAFMGVLRTFGVVDYPSPFFPAA